MIEIPAAALLIGCDDYRAFDASVGAPAGRSDLRGAVNDVKLWYAVARAMGIPAANIHVRTSPVLTAADLGEGADACTFGPATRDGILDGATALGRTLQGAPRAQGLLTWSGHGAVRDNEAILCPADLTSDLTAGISYSKLADALDEVLPAHGLTAVLDTCHAGGMAHPLDTAVGARTLERLSGAGRVAAPRLRPQDRVLAACGAGQVSESYRFKDVWHGAFT